MKKVFLLFSLLILSNSTFAQVKNTNSEHDVISEQEEKEFKLLEKTERDRLEREIALEEELCGGNKTKKRRNNTIICNSEFGIYCGYSTNKFANVGIKYMDNKVSYLFEIGVNNTTKINDYKLNTFIIDVGATYDATSNFYAGVIVGCGVNVTRIKYSENTYKAQFNGGFLIGYKFNYIDLSIKYTNIEQVCFRIGFNF